MPGAVIIRLAMAGANESSVLPRGEIVLDGKPLSLESLDSLWGRPLRVTLAECVWSAIDRSRNHIEAILKSGQTVYGVNTGFGHLCRTAIPSHQLDELQENLILSHAVGVGPDTPDDVVRWMMLFKLQGLAYGHSGVRRETVETLLGLLNHDLLPMIPTQGSLGASGDLAPLAHMVLPMIGRGAVRNGGRTIDVQASLGASGIADSGVRPIHLKAKEGLALINGTQFMSAYAAALVVRARRLLKSADVIAGMSLEALQGSIRPFDARMHELRRHPGALEVAANLRAMLAESEILASHANCGKVQDPYSLRCMATVHGATRDAVRHAAEIVERDINAVTDNPIIFDEQSVISGGNFHGQPLALALDYLAIALAELAGISERRIYLLLSGHDGLPTFLIRESGVNSGFMIVQYTAAALVSENKVLAHPASVDSIPTSLGQEDHVSMGATAAVKACRVLENAEQVLAIEQLCAAQGLDFRLPLKAGVGPRIAHATLRREIPHADRDRPFKSDIDTSVRLLRTQEITSAVLKKVPGIV